MWQDVIGMLKPNCCLPTVSFDDGLERVYGWFTDNWENIERDAEF